MSEPKFTGVWIPAQIFQSDELSNTAKLLYGVVAGLDGDDGCYASNAYLQASLRQGERAIQVVLKQLEDAGLIVREEINGKRIIRTVEGIALTGCKNMRGGVNKSAGRGCKKMHPYNKVDNKVDKNTGTEAMWIVRLPFGSDAFINAWKGWVAYHKERKKPLKDATVQAQCKQFKEWGEDKSIFAIQQSIMQGWAGIFEPKKNIGVYKAKPLTAEDHNQF
jgi:hypothetical protein